MTSLTTRIASPLISSIFIRSGLDAALDPEGKVKTAEKITRPIAERVTVLPDDTETLVRLNGATQFVAGTMLALGLWRRLAATVLIGSLVPTTLAGHRFWEEVDEEARSRQITQMTKNLGLLGGLLLVASSPATKRSPRSSAKGRTLRLLPFRRAR